MSNLVRQASVFIFIAVLFGANASIIKAQPVIDDSKNPEYLFTMSAKSGSFDQEKLTLGDVPLVVYFTDRPYRKSGHMSLEDFAKMWEQDVETYNQVPPNAELAIYDQDGDTHAVLIIDTPEITGSVISFMVTVLEGEIPETFDHATLFIDAFPTCVNDPTPICGT